MSDFIRLGTLVVNLDAVAQVSLEDQDADNKPCVTVWYCTAAEDGRLAGLRLHGAEAAALKRYLRGEATIVAEVAEAVRS